LPDELTPAPPADPTPEAPPPVGAPPLVPVMALRTYTALRLGSVAVIAVLAISLWLEHRTGNCWQTSISAYYYTGVQSVFVGTLITLGFVMIVLWGKTAFEDGFLNIAGMLAPVVAFVPTNDAVKCGITKPNGRPVSAEEAQQIIEAREHAIYNNMEAYLIVLTGVVAILLLIGIAAYRQHWKSITEHPVAYWGPWGMALTVAVIGWILVNKDDHDPSVNHTHSYAATFMFVFIGVVVASVGRQKWTGKHERDGKPHKGWARTYWVLALLMLVGGLAIKFIPGSQDFETHRTIWLEAYEILLLAAFWGLQTGDRWNEGAPPRTSTEAQRMGRPA